MTDQDLERAVAVALRAGLQSAEDIAAYIIARAAPIEVRESEAEEWRSILAFRGIVSRPTGATH